MPFRLLPAFQDAAWLQLAVILGDEDSASEVRSQRFIISDLSDIFISDILISDIFISDILISDILISDILVSYKKKK